MPLRTLPPGSIPIDGEGLDKAASDPLNNSFLNDPNDGSDPSTLALGQDGTAPTAYVTALPARRTG